MTERKVEKPRIFVAWAAWEPGWSMDTHTLCDTKSLAQRAADIRGWERKYVVRVEVREVKPRKKGKVKRGK